VESSALQWARHRVAYSAVQSVQLSNWVYCCTCSAGACVCGAVWRCAVWCSAVQFSAVQCSVKWYVSASRLVELCSTVQWSVVWGGALLRRHCCTGHYDTSPLIFIRCFHQVKLIVQIVLMYTKTFIPRCMLAAWVEFCAWIVFLVRSVTKSAWLLCAVYDDEPCMTYGWYCWRMKSTTCVHLSAGCPQILWRALPVLSVQGLLWKLHSKSRS
jgi:hypothetical protein